MRPRSAIAIGTAVAAAAVALALLFSRAPTNGPRRPATVRVGFIPFSNCLPFFVALERGYFDEREVHVEPVRFNNSSEALAALISGHIDALAGITFSSYWAVEQESPGQLKLFLIHYETPDDPFSYLLVPPQSPLREVSQLAGKRVGTYTGVSQLLYLRLFLAKVGLHPDRNVTVVQVGTELQIQALASGQYDALFTVEPYGTIAVVVGVARVLIASPRTKFIQNPFWGGAAAVTAQYLAANRPIVKATYDAMADGVRFVRDSVAQAKQYLIKYTPVDSAVAARGGLYRWVLVDEQFPLDGLQEQADTMAAEGVLRRRVDARAMLITSQDVR